MLSILQSNRLEVLADALIERASAAAADPDPAAWLAPQVVIVPSAGMGRWLKYRWAQRQGVCANVECLFPAQFIWQLFHRVLPDVPERSPFDPSVMAWRLFGLLETLPPQPELAPLARRLEGACGRDRLDLVQRIAGLFGQYTVYRPKWLEAWAQGRRAGVEDAATEAWQAWLWRALLERVRPGPTPHPKDAFFAALAEGGPAGERARRCLPARLPVFAVPLLPPLYLDILAGLGEWIDVDIHHLNPCREYWADIVPEAELARRRLDTPDAAALLDVGHPLLAAWGRQRGDALGLLAERLGEEGVASAEYFDPPAADTLLARLQGDILDLRPPPPPGQAPVADGSLQIHACHGLTRQLEVLHDRLLECFERLPGLTPADVVVMLPDLDAAAPLVEAVFGAVPREREIPFVITGRARPDDEPLVRACDFLLGQAQSRFEVAAIADFVELPAVSRRFGFEAADLERVHAWLGAAGVRWGRDAAHRAALGLPEEPRHTWAEGLARLLLGHALPGGGLEVFAGLAPVDEVEGQQALALGRLLRLLAVLNEAAAQLARPRTVAQWAAWLAGLIGQVFEAEGEDQARVERLRRAVAGLAGDAAQAGCTVAVDAEVLRGAVAVRLREGAPGAVPGGAVTFCGMGPLRGLPWRVVCLLDLNDPGFPRGGGTLEFDLMARHPQAGDRARRDDDRACFLDALSAARDAFIVCYSGRDIRDNAELPPSVLVAELLDHLGRATAGGRAAVEAALLARHPLAPFSPRYFDGGALFSYAAEHLPAARACARGAARGGGREFIDAAVPLAGEEVQRIRLEELADFLAHPVRYHLRHRLGLRFEEGEEALETREPLRLARRDGWRLEERLVALRLAGGGADRLRALAQASGELPHGLPGALALDELLPDVERFAAAVEALRPQPGGDLPFELRVDGCVIEGSLSGLGPEGLFAWWKGRRNWRGLARAWVGHLALNALAPAGVGRGSRLLLDDELLELAPLDDAARRLADLLALWREGLARPVDLPPRSTAAWLAASPDKALEKAWKTWRGDYRKAGECEEPGFRQRYGGVRGDLPEGFERLALRVAGPLQAALSGRDVAAMGATPCGSGPARDGDG
ncbi:MAG: exodeoxyribonuclease V subunit gamma [Betaproteobacteria bacterium]|nr:exodeoxyribonuclease V subunit gamma [Betaproteobacteria bacterium]